MKRIFTNNEFEISDNDMLTDSVSMSESDQESNSQISEFNDNNSSVFTNENEPESSSRNYGMIIKSSTGNIFVESKTNFKEKGYVHFLCEHLNIMEDILESDNPEYVREKVKERKSLINFEIVQNLCNLSSSTFVERGSERRTRFIQSSAR